MSNYYELYDYCIKTTDNNNIKKIRLLKNKETREKKILFRNMYWYAGTFKRWI